MDKVKYYIETTAEKYQMEEQEGGARMCIQANRGQTNEINWSRKHFILITDRTISQCYNSWHLDSTRSYMCQ